MRRPPALGSVLLRLVRGGARAVLIAAAASSATAAADEPAARVQLEWSAPDGCLDREAAREAIDAALGEHARTSEKPAVARVRIAQLPDGRWNADIWMYGTRGSGERSFTGASCANVAEAAALVVAMAIDGSDEARTARPPAAPEADAAGTPTRLFAGVRIGGDLGALPAASPGAGLVLGVEHGALRAELEGTAWLPQVARSAPPAQIGGRFGLFTFGVRGCFDALGGDGALQLGPCLGGEAGVATGRGVDISDPETNTHLWAAGLAGLSLRYARPAQLSLALLAEAGVPLRRPTWEIEDFADVFRASAVLGRVSLTAAWLFP